MIIGIENFIAYFLIINWKNPLKGHIPPSGSCYQAWIHNYIRISVRYQHLITASYFGHTHKDELLVLYNKNKNHETIPATLSYIGPSITTFEYINPGYRIFTLNGNVSHCVTRNLITITLRNICIYHVFIRYLTIK
jgi:hypothetical protein